MLVGTPAFACVVAGFCLCGSLNPKLCTPNQGDTLVSIAASMRTTVKALLDHNRDLLDAAQLEEGQKVPKLITSFISQIM